MGLLGLLLLSLKTTALNLIPKRSEPDLRSVWKILLNERKTDF